MQQRPPIGRERYGREPRNTNEARHAITETRSRISQDLDAIEDQIVEKRDELKAKADVLTPARRRIRERLWPSLGIALGTGFVLGAMGGDEEEAEPKEEKAREGRRRFRQQRKARMRVRRRHARKRKEGRPGAGFGSAAAGTLGGAVVSGLATRVKRYGRDLLAGRR